MGWGGGGEEGAGMGARKGPGLSQVVLREGLSEEGKGGTEPRLAEVHWAPKGLKRARQGLWAGHRLDGPPQRVVGLPGGPGPEASTSPGDSLETPAPGPHPGPTEPAPGVGG